ncbi:MAG: hypothetical protein JSU86_09420 [Phycisphaerales bacterium]|nr:MAG: hypothetical protein JSU86_09420 [Phycisphaerales bacterium]
MTSQCFNFYAHRDRAVAALTSVARQADCYRLTAVDIRVTCDVIESLVCKDAALKVG